MSARCHESCALPNGWNHHCWHAPCLLSFTCKHVLSAHIASTHKSTRIPPQHTHQQQNLQLKNKKRVQLGARAAKKRELSSHRIVVIALGSHEIRVGLASASEPTSRVRTVVAWRKVDAAAAAAAVNQFTTSNSDLAPKDEKESAAHARALAASLAEWREDSTLFPHEFIHTALTDAVSDDGPLVLPDDALVATSTVPAPTCVVGEEALRLSPDAPYSLVYPIEQGYVAHNDKLAVSTEVALASIEALLRHALLGVGIDDTSIGSYAACLIVPTMHRRRDTVALVDLLLERLAFAEVFVNTDAMCAALGSVHDTACIVDIGHQRTTVACVFEGVVQAESRCHMPFGAQGVAAALMRFLSADDAEAGGSMFGARSLSVAHARDLALVERLRNALCHVDVRQPFAPIHRAIRLRTLDFDLGRPGVRELLLDHAKSDSFSTAALTLFSPGALNCASPTPAAVAQFADDAVADDIYSQQWLRAVDNVEVMEPRPTRVKAKGYVPRAAAGGMGSATDAPKLHSCQVGDTGLITVVVETPATSHPLGYDPELVAKVTQLHVGATVALRPDELAAFYVAGGRVMEAPLDALPPLENGKLVWTPQFHAVFIAAIEIAHTVGEGSGPSAILKYMTAIGAPPINKPQVSSHLQKWRKDMGIARGRSRRSTTLDHELQLAAVTAVSVKGKSRKSTDGPGAGDDGPPPLQPIGGVGAMDADVVEDVVIDDDDDDGAGGDDGAALKKRKREDDAAEQTSQQQQPQQPQQPQGMQTDPGAAEESKSELNVTPMDPKSYAHQMLPLQVARPEQPTTSTHAAMPLDEAVLQSVLSLDWASASLRVQLMNNIVVVGGGALIGGIQQLLEARLICHPEVPSESVATVNYSQQSTPQLLAWRGAALMAWQPSARRLYVSQGEWQLYGSAVLRERVPFKW
jgi:actin-related protein